MTKGLKVITFDYYLTIQAVPSGKKYLNAITNQLIKHRKGELNPHESNITIKTSSRT